LNYVWSPTVGLSATNTATVTASPDTTTMYFVHITDEVGCVQNDYVTITVGNVFENEEICLVTVDTVVWKNKIIWQPTLGVGTIGYNVYKEVATNIYSGIGFVAAGDPTWLIDVNSQPESYGNRYKITAIDTCGNESEKSFYHNTMNLTIAAFGSTMGLSWTPYIDESGVFEPSLYHIYRGTTPADMQWLASIPGTQTSYNDNNVFTIYYYLVGVERSGGCNPGEKSVITTSFSNKKDNSTLVSNRQSLGYETLSGLLTAYPNPFTETTTITFYNPDNKPYTFILTDATGRMVRKENNINGNQFILDKGNLSAGVYMLELKGVGLFRGKLVVE
jgi:hypothetical protein